MHRGFPFCAGTMMSVSPLFSLSTGWKQLFSKINCFCTAVFPAIDQPAVPLCLKCRVACGGLYCQGFECFQAGHGYTTGLFMFGTEPVKLGGNLYAIISAWHSYLPVLLWLKGIYRWPDDLPGNTYLSPQRLLRVSGMCFLAAWGGIGCPSGPDLRVTQGLWAVSYSLAIFIRTSVRAKKGRWGDPHCAAARIGKSLPHRKLQLSPSYKIHYCVSTVSVM